MSFNESPSLKDYQDGIPIKQVDPSRRKRITRAILIILVAMSLVLCIRDLIVSGSMNVLLGKGAVGGRVFNQEGAPLAGEVFILGMDQEVKISSDGYFLLEGIPAGYQSVVVAYNGTAEEYPVEIIPGETTDLDEIQFLIVTQMPGQ